MPHSGQRMPKEFKAADAEVRRGNVDLLTLFALQQVIQHVGMANFNVVNNVGDAHGSIWYPNQWLIQEYPHIFDIVGIERDFQPVTHRSDQTVMNPHAMAKPITLQLLHRPIHVGSGEIFHIELTEDGFTSSLPSFARCTMHYFQPSNGCHPESDGLCVYPGSRS
jgi:hypothetical protein